MTARTYDGQPLTEDVVTKATADIESAAEFGRRVLPPSNFTNLEA